MRVEVYDESGNRYIVTLEGRVTRKNALRILDIVELLGGMPGVASEFHDNLELPKIEKVRFVVEKHFPLVWFSARDIQSVYEKETKEPIGLSTISTYLSRLSDRGMLMRTKNSNRVLYKLISTDVKELIKKL
jgi:hypothetical protein